MPPDASEEELVALLVEMYAESPWAALDRSEQVLWLDWIRDSGELPRVRMYEAAHALLAGRRAPPNNRSASRIRGAAGGVLGVLFDALLPPWWH